MNRSKYWEKIWNYSAESGKPDIRQISGWGMIQFNDMLYIINDIIDKLGLTADDIFLDAGCGAGLFEIAFAYRVKEIHAIDYSENMIRQAKENNIYSNVFIKKGNIKNLDFEDGFFNKVLVNSSIQYLDDMGEVTQAIHELIRVTKKGGKILLSLIPDAEAKQEFIDGYGSLGFTGEELNKKIESANQCLWFERGQLKDIIAGMGVGLVHHMSPFNGLQKKYYFDLIIER